MSASRQSPSHAATSIDEIDYDPIGDNEFHNFIPADVEEILHSQDFALEASADRLKQAERAIEHCMQNQQDAEARLRDLQSLVKSYFDGTIADGTLLDEDFSFVDEHLPRQVHCGVHELACFAEKFIDKPLTWSTKIKPSLCMAMNPSILDEAGLFQWLAWLTLTAIPRLVTDQQLRPFLVLKFCKAPEVVRDSAQRSEPVLLALALTVATQLAQISSFSADLLKHFSQRIVHAAQEPSSWIGSVCLQRFLRVLQGRVVHRSMLSAIKNLDATFDEIAIRPTPHHAFAIIPVDDNYEGHWIFAEEQTDLSIAVVASTRRFKAQVLELGKSFETTVYNLDCGFHIRYTRGIDEILDEFMKIVMWDLEGVWAIYRAMERYEELSRRPIST